MDTLVANTLSSVLFSDIFLSSDEADPILVLNLSGEGIRPTKSRGPMVLPDVYRSDARSLFRATEQKWSAERFAPEFNLVYDSLAYRCSQIAAPESAVQIPRESSLRRRDATGVFAALMQGAYPWTSWAIRPGRGKNFDGSARHRACCWSRGHSGPANPPPRLHASRTGSPCMAALA